MSSVGDLTRKTFTTSRSFTYTYHDSAPGKPPPIATPAILFLHGFPDNAHLWRMILPYIDAELPNRIIALDQEVALGEKSCSDKDSKSTSSTISLSSFSSSSKKGRTYQDVAADMAELFAAEGVSRVKVVGYDWGTFNAQRVLYWRPEMVVSITMLSVLLVKESGDAKTKRPVAAPSTRPWGSILTASTPGMVVAAEQWDTFTVKKVMIPSLDSGAESSEEEEKEKKQRGGRKTGCLLARGMVVAWRAVYWRSGGTGSRKRI